MPKIVRLSPNDESSVCAHSLCRKLSYDSKNKSSSSSSSVKLDRLMWSSPSHLEQYLSNRHQMFREVLKPMSPVSFKRDDSTQQHKVSASKSPYLKHMKSLRVKELFLLKSGLISDSSNIADANLKKEIALQNQLQSIVSPINIPTKRKTKKHPKGNRLKPFSSNTSSSSVWSDDGTLESNMSLHADTLSYLVTNSSNSKWWKNNRSVSSGDSGGSEYGIFEGELVSLNGDDELISNDSDSIR